MKLCFALFLFAVLAAVVSSRSSELHTVEKPERMQFDTSNIGICLEKPLYGKCKGRRQLWFFNKHKRRCEKFIYSNCGGNTNRFFTKEECDIVCTENVKAWLRKDMPNYQIPL